MESNQRIYSQEPVILLSRAKSEQQTRVLCILKYILIVAFNIVYVVSYLYVSNQ